MAKTIKQPIHSGVCKVPVVMQLEALECGAASLTMILAYYGKWMPLEQIRVDCGVSRDGANAMNLLKAARYYGLEAKGLRRGLDSLREKGSFPCIIHWEFNHFVVLDGFKGNFAYLNDPAKGSYRVPLERFDEGFTGVVLEFAPGPEFQPSGKPKSMFTFARRRLEGAGSAVAFTGFSCMLASLLKMISPAFTRFYLDNLLTLRRPQWAVPFFGLLLTFCAMQIAVSALQSIYTRRISGKMAAVGNATYMWKVLRLPMQFFTQRMAGDIQMRQSTNASIADTLINTITPLALNCGMLVFYLVVMIRYSWLLALIGLGSFAINTLLSRYISEKRINITRVAMRDEQKLMATTVAGVEMIESIKASGAENGFFAKWSGYQASVNTQNIRYLKLNAYLGAIPSFLTEFSNLIVLLLSGWLVMEGEFTVGMVLAFQTILASFMEPAQTLISAGQTIQEMRTQMERVEDVMQYPIDDAFADENRPELESGAFIDKLSGRVELKHITFGYSRLAPPLIQDFNLTLEPGKSVAFVGSSGCGKSTMSKLLSGLYQPWSGEVLYDGKPLKSINKGVFTSSLAVVDQDIILFEDTIANNIKMWDDSIEDFAMILAARDAQIHDAIMERPNGYQHVLLEGGRDLSGGQRQRLEIARVLAQDPTIVIMDEATSALDAKTEYNVVNAIRERGITSIVIAHRLSTVRSCDEIIVMEHGCIVDRGTHAQLMESCPLYRELVISE